AATQAQARDRFGRTAGGLLPVEGDRARGGRQVAREQVGQGGLAGAIGSDDGVQPVADQVNRNVVDGGQAAEALGQAARAQQGFFVHSEASVVSLRPRPSSDSPRPSRPRGATMTTSRMKPPMSSCQCLVRSLKKCITYSNANAPTMAPAKLPMPPRMTIMMACALM